MIPASACMSRVFTFKCVFFQYRFISIKWHNGTMLPKCVYVLSCVKLAFCRLGELLLPPIYGRNLPLNACQPPVQDYGRWGCCAVI
jgi:hypothetical protein